VVRHTKDELLAMYRPTKVIGTLGDMPDIISSVSLPPILSETLDAQTVRIYPQCLRVSIVYGMFDR
jgi:hypothetical protein